MGSVPGASAYDLTAIINLALGLDKNGNGTESLNNPNNMFPSFLDQSPSTSNLAGMQRQAPSPVNQHPNNVNGGGAMNGMNVAIPMNAGQQMDMNMLYQKVLELSDVLRGNREQTRGLVASAEELAVRIISLSRPYLASSYGFTCLQPVSNSCKFY